MTNYLEYFIYYKLLPDIPTEVKEQIGEEDNFNIKQIKELNLMDYIDIYSRYVDKGKLQEWLQSKLGKYNFYLVYSDGHWLGFDIYRNIYGICGKFDVLFINEEVYEGLKCSVHKISNTDDYLNTIYIMGLSDEHFKYLQSNANNQTAYELIKNKFEI